MKSISLIIPAKNESLSLGKVLDEIKNYKIIDEIIVVVDNENDDSIKIAKNYNCKILIQKNNGYGSAIIEGFRNAKNEYGCIFNADYSFNPKYLSEMINKTPLNFFVFGSRYVKEGFSEDDDFITLIGNKCFSFFSKYFLKIKVSDILFTYILCDVDKFNKLNLKSHDFRLCIELPFKISKNFDNYCELPMIERARFAGKKNVNVLKDGFLILLEVVKSYFQALFNIKLK
tara:strand:- start:71 stop:760 length:690 start_codon:yes stop_codon:yes gene_type:complete